MRARLRRWPSPGVPAGGLRGADWQPSGERVQRVGRSADLPDRRGGFTAGHAFLPGDVRREREGPQRSVAIGRHNATGLGEAHW